MRKKLLYTKKEVAQALSCSIGKIDKLMASGQIKYFKYGQTKQSGVKFAVAHIEEYLQQALVKNVL